MLGAQGNVWTEFISTTEHLEYMVLPRMLALAEVVWSPAKNWSDFRRRVQHQFKVFDEKGFHYSPGNFTVEITPVSGHGKLEVSLFSEIPSTSICYTTDGTLPNISSSKYSQPVPIESSQTIKAVSVQNGRIMNSQPAQQTFVWHKAVGGNVTYLFAPSSRFPADGSNTLTNGVRGGNLHNKYRHGFEQNNMVATVDLNAEKNISQLSLCFLQNYEDRVFFPGK